MKSVKYYAVVPAAGIGQRMQANKPKQYLPLAEKTVIEQTLSRLVNTRIFATIVVAISEKDPYWSALTLAKHPEITIASGGKERADSVLSALKKLENQAEEDDWILVHDAARPCVTNQEIQQLIATLKNETTGGILALPLHDTVKQVDGDTIQTTLNRETIWRALTPQMFRYRVLKEALAHTEGLSTVTDEASAVELTGGLVKIVEGRRENIKITCPEDLALAEFYWEQQKND
jgi:2-C-methyl-D-erythritol 4-phosphate cytidylyltransferase